MRKGQIPILILMIMLILIGISNLMYSGVIVLTNYYASSDEEVIFMNTKTVFEGKGWYRDFSSVYPPGRYLVNSLVFRLLAPSLAVQRMMAGLWSVAIFPAVLFLLTYLVLFLLPKKIKPPSVMAYFLAIVSALIYLFFIRGAQEAHGVSAILLIALFGKNTKYTKVLGGFLLGMIVLFRIDAGILMALALGLVFFSDNRKGAITHSGWKPIVAGFGLVWAPMIIRIATRGSLTNFLHDTLYLGLWVQPRFMGLPIPENALGLVFWSALVLVLGTDSALFIDSRRHKNRATAVLALFVALSLVSAFGRSDEGHLFYGLVWLPVLIVYGLWRLVAGIREREIKADIRFLVLVAVVSLGLLIMVRIALIAKSALFWLIMVLGFFLFWDKRRSKVATALIFGALLASITVFHSINYLKLRWQPPRINFGNFVRKVPDTEGMPPAGIVFVPEEEAVLQKIKQDLDPQSESLFIFPDHVIYYEYFKRKNPTRYFYYHWERTEKTENEIVRSLTESGVKDIIVFRHAAELRGDKAWKWVLDNTKITMSYPLGNDIVDLRKRI